MNVDDDGLALARQALSATLKTRLLPSAEHEYFAVLRETRAWKAWAKGYACGTGNENHSLPFTLAYNVHIWRTSCEAPLVPPILSNPRPTLRFASASLPEHIMVAGSPVLPVQAIALAVTALSSGNLPALPIH